MVEQIFLVLILQTIFFVSYYQQPPALVVQRRKLEAYAGGFL